MKIQQLSSIKPIHSLVYGDPKTGKSTLVSKLAEAGVKLIWVSMDNGHEILKKLSPAAQENVELIVLPDTRDYPVAVDSFRKIMEKMESKFCFAHGKNLCSVCIKAGLDFTEVNFGSVPMDTVVVFDNVSQLSDSYQALICKGKPIDYKLQLDDWGALNFHLKKAFADMQQAPFHLIAIAHSVEEKITDGSVRIMPAVGSSTFAPKVCGYFDHVIYCNLLNKSHRFGSATTYLTNVLTGSRTDVEIEKMMKADGKTAAPSLLPFFDGSIKPAADVAASSHMEKVVALHTQNIPTAVQQIEDAVILSETSGLKIPVFTDIVPGSAEQIATTLGIPQEATAVDLQATAIPTQADASTESPSDRARRLMREKFGKR